MSANKNNFLACCGSKEHVQSALESEDNDEDIVPAALLNHSLHKDHLNYIINAKHGKYNKFSDFDVKYAKEHLDGMK